MRSDLGDITIEVPPKKPFGTEGAILWRLHIRDGTTECLSARLAVHRNFVAVSKLDADVELLPVER